MISSNDSIQMRQRVETSDQDYLILSKKIIDEFAHESKKHNVSIHFLGMNEKYKDTELSKRYEEFISYIESIESDSLQLISKRNLMQELDYLSPEKNLIYATHLWHGHFNFRGNKKLAKIISEYLLSLNID